MFVFGYEVWGGDFDLVFFYLHAHMALDWMGLVRHELGSAKAREFSFWFTGFWLWSSWGQEVIESAALESIGWRFLSLCAAFLADCGSRTMYV